MQLLLDSYLGKDRLPAGCSKSINLKIYLLKINLLSIDYKDKVKCYFFC